jgi:hypothetical protein
MASSNRDLVESASDCDAAACPSSRFVKLASIVREAVSVLSESALPGAHAENRGGGAPILIAWLMALAIIALTVVPMIGEAIRDGTLFDNDDATRLVQMREWMAGKSWFDVTERRIDPPAGMTSHWSRLIELPMAGAIRALSTVTDRGLAERVVVAVWPCVLLSALVLLILCVTARLFAPPTLLAAAAMVALNPLLQFQLLPGRIDHHGMQMLLTLLMAFSTLRAIVDKRTGAALLAGVLGSVSLAIGLETAPLVVVSAALFGVVWIVEGERSRRVVFVYGATFALATLLLFAATVPTARWAEAKADTLSPPWLWMAAGGGGALVALACLRTQSSVRRAALAFAAAIIVSAIFAAVWPHVLAGPLADIDPLVRVLWAEAVGESKPLPLLVAQEPASFLYFLAFPTLGWLGLGAAAFREGRRRPDFLLLFAFATMGLVLALGQMRGASFASLFALFGWLYPVDWALASFGDGKNRGRLLVACCVVLAALFGSLPYPWSALGNMAKASPAESAPLASCGERTDMAALAAEPRGLVLAPLRLGPRILVATDHDVLAAPYHRNNDGNRFALEALTGPPDAAHALIKSRGVTYVAICLGDTDLPRLTAYRDGSFLATLVGGTPPAWLAPIEPRGPIRAWRVVD